MHSTNMEPDLSPAACASWEAFLPAPALLLGGEVGGGSRLNPGRLWDTALERKAGPGYGLIISVSYRNKYKIPLLKKVWEIAKVSKKNTNHEIVN